MQLVFFSPFQRRDGLSHHCTHYTSWALTVKGIFRLVRFFSLKMKLENKVIFLKSALCRNYWYSHVQNYWYPHTKDCMHLGLAIGGYFSKTVITSILSNQHSNDCISYKDLNQDWAIWGYNIDIIIYVCHFSGIYIYTYNIITIMQFLLFWILKIVTFKSISLLFSTKLLL